MLRLLTDLNVLNRFDVAVDNDVFSDDKVAQGSWLVKRGDKLEKPAEGALDALQVFTEANRDGKPGFSPDASAGPFKRLTVLLGHY